MKNLFKNLNYIYIYKQDSIKMQIQTFNQKLTDENVDINIIAYVKLLNNETYHIDISFIDDFINLVNEDQ